MKFYGSEVFNHWKSWVSDNYQTSRFLRDSRDEIISELFTMLTEAGVDHEDARNYKSEVIKFLVTREGSKGTGKYKGWKENVEMAFDSIFVETFIEKQPIKEVIQPPKEVIEQDPIIKLWGIERFGVNWNDKMELEARVIGSPMFNLFYQDCVENTPSWMEEL